MRLLRFVRYPRAVVPDQASRQAGGIPDSQLADHLPTLRHGIDRDRRLRPAPPRVRSARSALARLAGGLRGCALTWREQKIFECESFFVLGGFFERGGNLRDVVQGRVGAGQDMNLYNGHAILFLREGLSPQLDYAGTQVDGAARSPMRKLGQL